MSLKAKIEAVLYMTDKPLRAQAIAGIVGEELQVVRQTLLDLIHEYEERQGGLEIADEDGYSFQVRDQFANLMDQFMPIEMTAAQLRTLSAIAIKQPIAQSEIIRIRGAGAYDHIKELVIRGLIAKREDEKNRSPMLSTTKQFQEYFRLTKDGKSLRQYLKREMKKKDKEDAPLGDAAGVDVIAAELLGAASISAESLSAEFLGAEVLSAELLSGTAADTLSFAPEEAISAVSAQDESFAPDDTATSPAAKETTSQAPEQIDTVSASSAQSVFETAGNESLGG
jgi:segregation and condensation protein B